MSTTKDWPQHEKVDKNAYASIKYQVSEIRCLGLGLGSGLGLGLGFKVWGRLKVNNQIRGRLDFRVKVRVGDRA